MHGKARAGASPKDVHAWLVSARARKGQAAPHLTNVRRALRGLTFRRGRVERRGRKPALSRRSVHNMNRVRQRLIKDAQGRKEVHWKDVLRAPGPQPPSCAPHSRVFCKYLLRAKRRRRVVRDRLAASLSCAL